MNDPQPNPLSPGDRRRLASAYGKLSVAFAELAALNTEIGLDVEAALSHKESSNYNLLAVQAQASALDAERRAGLRA